MNRKKMIIQINFNNAKFTEKRLTKEWIERRIELFNRFTLKSLKKQTNQNFEALLYYDPVSIELINDALSKYEKLPGNIKFLTSEEGKKYIYNAIRDYDYLYFIRLDSDNMYHQSFIQQLYDIEPKEDTQFLISTTGYIYDYENDILAKYCSVYGFFYTIVYKTGDYLKGISYKLPPPSISIDKSDIPHEILDKPNFTIGIHSKNSLLTSNLIKKIIRDPEEAKAVLKEFI